MDARVTISLCVPCGNRLRDLLCAAPTWIVAANASPPVEIAILDYNSSDGLREFCEWSWGRFPLTVQNEWTCRRYEGREHYHMAHAYNLAVKASRGEYVTIAGADAILDKAYFDEVRKRIAKGAAWMRGPHYKGVLVIQRQEFIDAGGYDERLEFYSGEDKELEERLRRRGAKFGLMPDGLVHTLRTSEADKLANFRLPLTKTEMMKRGTAIRAENAAGGLLVANEGKEWGQWE